MCDSGHVINFATCLSGVMVSLLTSNVVDHGFDHWSDQTKNHKFGICCFSAEHAALWSKNKDLVGTESVECVQSDLPVD